MDNITYSKHGRTFIKVSDAPSQRDIPRISISEIAHKINPDKVCRTCAHVNDRLWELSSLERSHVVRNNLQESAQCSPKKADHVFKHTADGLRFEEWTRSSGAEIIGVVDSCGWTANSKCSTCVHFSTTTVSQPYQQWDGGPTRYRQLTVAGHCKLASSCDYKRRPRALDPSCLNCDYLVYTFGDKFITDEYGRDVVKAALDPYEMAQVRKVTRAESSREGGAYPGVIFNKFTSMYTSNHVGLYRYFFGPLVNVRTINGEVLPANAAVGMDLKEIESIEVTFANNNWWFPTVAEDHEPTGFVYWGTRSDGHFGYVRFYGTGYTKFGIEPSNTVKNYNYGALFDVTHVNATRRMNHSEWTCSHGQQYRDSLAATTPVSIADCYSNRCSICVRSAMYVHRVDVPDFADRVDDNCNFCRPGHACGAHARLLTRVTKDDDEYWYFADPSSRDGLDVHTARQQIVCVDGRFVHSDGTAVHPSLILSSARSMIDNAYLNYKIRVRNVKRVDDVVLHNAYKTIDELTPYIEQLRGELVSFAKHAEVIERVIARLERRIASANKCITAHVNAKLKFELLERELNDTITAVVNAKAQVLASVPTKPNAYVSVDVGYGAPMSVEPFKHYCALSLPRVIHGERDGIKTKRHIPAGFRGIDFREVMGDTFGAMRGTQTSIASRGSFRSKITRKNLLTGDIEEHEIVQRHGTYVTDSWVDIMAMDERIRGTNPLERVQEEMLINQAMVYDRLHDKHVDVADPTVWHVIKLDMGVTESAVVDTLSWSPLGKPIDDWAVYPPEADRALYLEWLDQKSEVVMHTAEVDVDEDITRDDLGAEWTNRWRIHGYENYRGFARRSNNDDAMVFSFNHQRRTSDEVRSVAVHSFVCNLCDETYSSEEMVEDSNCPDCNVPLIWVETSHEDKVSVSLSQLPDIPKGRQMGIGFATAADSPRYQNETRLTRMCCDNWTLRGSGSNARPTRLSDI